ncbi:MAG: hypothetical protein ABDH49_07870 [Candidatus Hydrothermales bacterium]
MRKLLIFLTFTLGCVALIEEKKGPPPHAKAYGYREKYLFWYYPSLEIYYDVKRDIYIVMEGGNWVEVKTKPKGIEIAEYVIIETSEDKPWKKHSYYKNKYKVKKEKGK